jgi:hypothetical protein
MSLTVSCSASTDNHDYRRRPDRLDNLPPSTAGRLDIHKATGNPRLYFSNAEPRSGCIKPLVILILVDCCAPPHGAAFHRFIDARDGHVPLPFNALRRRREGERTRRPVRGDRLRSSGRDVTARFPSASTSVTTNVGASSSNIHASSTCRISLRWDAHACKPANVAGAVPIRSFNTSNWAMNGASDIK